ncbi:MAG: hypothetical protein IJY16_04840 [Clostridia bacterium]|nr:hypothetical protein [Clostridia bacterium]
MFYDERIELERGKIARNGILLATLYALLCGMLRWMNVLLNMDGSHTYPKSYYYLPVWFEIAVAVTGLVCLAVGLFFSLGRPKDERLTAECAAYWRRAGTLQLFVSLAALALFYPLSLLVQTNINYAAVDTMQVAVNLFLLLAAYVAFAFKERDIYFNYAALESPRYGLAVLKNLGKLGILTLCGLGISCRSTALGALWLQHTRIPEMLLASLLLWLLIFIILAITYTMLSVLERLSYEKRRVLSGATFATLLLVILLRAAYTAVEALLLNSGATMVEQLIALNYFAWLPLAAGFWFVLFLIYFYHEYRETGRDRLARVGFLLVLGAEVPGGALDFLLSVFQMIFHRSIIENIEQNLLFGKINGWLAAFTYLVFLAGFVLLIAGPVRRALVGKKHLIPATLLTAVALGVEIFLYTQLHGNTLLLIRDGIALIRQLYLALFLFLLSRSISEGDSAAIRE